MPAQYRSAFTHAALDTSLPVAMLVAVAQVESQMTPGGRSPSDARGLLQVLPLALAAYNAGPTAVADAGGAPTQETLEYVANVTSLWRKLRDCR